MIFVPLLYSSWEKQTDRTCLQTVPFGMANIGPCMVRKHQDVRSGGIECKREHMRGKKTECPRLLESGLNIPNIRKIWHSPISALETSALKMLQHCDYQTLNLGEKFV